MKIFILLLALGLCLADAVPGGYQPIDITEAQADPTIQSYIQAGLDAVVQNAVNKGFFSNSNFTLVSINSVAEQVVNGANYKFDCNFTDSTGVVIAANFVIYQSAATNATTVTSYAYKVYYPATTTTTTTTTTSGTPATTVETEEENSAEATTTESGEPDSTTTTTTVNGQASNNSTTETATTTTTDAATNTTETSTEASVNSTTPVSNETAVETPNGFIPISADEFSQSEDLRRYFTYGFENVVQNGINSGKIPNTTFSAAKVLGASYKTFKNGELYKFTAEASNGDDVELELGFQVSIRVPAYTYRVKITTTVPANNTSGDNSTTPVDTGAGDNNTTTPVDTAAGDNNTTTPVDTGDGDNNTTTPVDTGAGSDSDNTTTPVDTGAGSGSDNNTTTPVDNGSGSDNNSTTTPVDNGSGSDNNTTIPVDTNTTTNTTSPSEDEWIVIDPAQVQQSAELQSNLAQGFNQVIQTVVQKKLLAADNYTVTQVVAISYHNLTKGVNYKFTVKANNDAQTFFLDMNFTTYYRYSNQSVKTVAYHYNYSTKAAPVGQDTTSNNTTPAQNTTTPAQNNTTPAQNTTTPAQNNTNSTTGYVALSADEIQAQDVQNAINYGSDQVVQNGIQKGKIPSDTYNITQVASVLKKIQPSGANYNATVTLQSAANVTVTTNFNVFYNSASNAMILKAYSYGVTGIKKNNGNSTKN